LLVQGKRIFAMARSARQRRSQGARTYEELDQAITNALDAVTEKDIIGWFTHCCYYIAPN
jgi:hypothetical protein